MSEITQADRDRAGGYYEAQSHWGLGLALREGKQDDHPLLALLASHREAAIEARSDETGTALSSSTEPVPESDAPDPCVKGSTDG